MQIPQIDFMNLKVLATISVEVIEIYIFIWNQPYNLDLENFKINQQGNFVFFYLFQNEHQKTDGGLGAGTPMFITEVMHGSACNIL